MNFEPVCFWSFSLSFSLLFHILGGRQALGARAYMYVPFSGDGVVAMPVRTALVFPVHVDCQHIGDADMYNAHNNGGYAAGGSAAMIAMIAARLHYWKYTSFLCFCAGF